MAFLGGGPPNIFWGATLLLVCTTLQTNRTVVQFIIAILREESSIIATPVSKASVKN